MSEMTNGEIRAFDRGVLAVLAIAEAAAGAIRVGPGYRATRDEFAAATLIALAEEGRALLKEDPNGDVARNPSGPLRPKTGGGESQGLAFSTNAE